MTAPYNISIIQDQSGYFAYFNAVNVFSDGQFGIWILVAVFAIGMIVSYFRATEWGSALLGNMIITTVVSILLYWTKIITQDIVGIVMALLFFSVIFKLFGTD